MMRSTITDAAAESYDRVLEGSSQIHVISTGELIVLKTKLGDIDVEQQMTPAQAVRLVDRLVHVLKSIGLH